MMKLTTWALALLTFAAVSHADELRFLQAAGATDTTETAADSTDTAAADGEATDTTAEDAAKKDEEATTVVDPAKKHDPEGEYTDDTLQNIFTQGTVNWYAGKIYSPYTVQQVKTAKKGFENEDDETN